MKTLVENVGLAGFTELYETRKYPLRFLFWVTVLTAMLLACGYSTANTVMNYIDSPTVTTISVRSNASMAIPDMLLCYKGGWNGTTMKEAGLSDDLMKTLLLKYLNPSATSNINETLRAEFDNHLITSKTTIEEFYKKIAFGCSDILEQRVKANDYRHGIGNKCDDVSTLMVEHYAPDNCLLLKNNGVQAWPGLEASLHLTLVEPQDSSMTLLFDKRENGFDFEFASRFVTHTYKRTSVQSNVQAYVVLKATQYIRLKEFGQCENTDRSGYVFNHCFLDCYRKAYFKQCNCVLSIDREPISKPSAPIPSRLCSIFDFHECLFEKKMEVFEAVSQCSQSCLPPCEEWQYDVTVSAKILDNVDDNVTKSAVRVGYNSIQFTKIEEVTSFSIDMAFGNVGGIISLYLGGGFITIFQFVYYTALHVTEKKVVNNKL